MSVSAVLDANILLYAASKDPADATRAVRALELMETEDFGLSLQIVQEFYHNARIKARLAIPAAYCERMVTALLQRPLIITDVSLFQQAQRVCNRYQVRYWDAAVLAAAKRLAAPILYTEDLNHGQDYDGVKVVNPFRD